MTYLTALLEDGTDVEIVPIGLNTYDILENGVSVRKVTYLDLLAYLLGIKYELENALGPHYEMFMNEVDKLK